MLQQVHLKDLEDGDDSSSNSDDGIKTGKIPLLSKLRAINWKKIGIIAAIVIIIIILFIVLSEEDTKNDGKFNDGDLSNVPYVISSMVMDKLVIVYDASNNYTYAFQNKDGEYVDLEESISEAIDTLKENESTALSYLGEDASKKEQIKLLKKMIQAEIATQYPDLTLNENLGLTTTSTTNNNSAVSTGSGNDYCVDMTSPNALPACSEAQLNQIVENSIMGEQGKSNMKSAIPDLVKFQKQYNVNAVFFMAVCQWESGWGTSTGGAIDMQATHNWCSIRNDQGGWRTFSSFGEASEGFFSLISGGKYFGSGCTTVKTIAQVYDNVEWVHWSECVAGSIENFYKSIGITPNISTAVTASGGEGNSSEKSTSSKTSSISKGNPAVTGTTATGGNQGFLEKAAEVKKIVADKKMGYYIFSTMDSSDPSASSLINCANYVSWSLMADGYNPTTGNLLINSSTQLMHWCEENGFEQVYAGQTLSVDEAGLQPGDILIEGSEGGNEESIVHTQIYAGKNESGEDIWYNCGGEHGNSAYPGEDNFSNPNAPEHYILWAYRVPGGSTASSSPSNVTSTTGDEEIDEEIDQDKTAKGGIKVQRKNTDGSTIDLKYTSTKNFNALVSKNDPRALEYYTLVKTSGSSNKTNNTTSTNLQTDGTAEGNAAAIFSFFVSKGVTKEGAAGMLGNMENESAFMPNKLEIDKSSKFGITDEEYTAQVDDGTIDRDNFLDYHGMGWSGYGIVQWTADPIKGELYDFAKSQNTSIADLGMQCEVLYQQLSTKSYYSKLWNVLTTTTSVSEAADTFLEEYEKPASYNYDARRSSAQKWYEKLANSTDTSLVSTTSGTSNTTTSGTSGTASANVSNTSTTTGSFVDVATKCHAFIRNNNYSYSNVGRDLPVENGDCAYIDCSSFVSMALEQYGLKDWSGYPHQLTDTSLVTYGTSKLQTIAENASINTVEQLKSAGAQAGDIVKMNTHTQILYGYDSSGNAIWLNCGGERSINAPEGTDTSSSFDTITHIFRVPGSSASGSVISSLDNFLFIGDSRYKGIESQLNDLGNNVTSLGVGGSTPAEWIDVVKNGSGYVDSPWGEDVTLPETVSGVSVMLGVNDTSQISEMKEVLNGLHERYPSAPIMVNSVYHVGTAYNNHDSMNSNVDEFNQAMQDFCNQNSWAYYVDITQNLYDDSGYLKSEYSSDGLHIFDAEGINTLVDNIKNGILSSGAATTAETLEDGTGRAGYAIVVANKKDVTTTVTDSYEYAGSYTVEKANGHTGSASKTTATPASQVVSSTSTTQYSSQNADYQAALQNFTLYFDFLWAILVDSNNTKLVTRWADLVSKNVADKSKVILTVYTDEDTSTSSTTQSKGTIVKTSGSDGDVVSCDNYNVTETKNVKTVTLQSKPCITSADTWLVNYENEADDYSEYQSKTEEKINEKIDVKSKENNIIKILRKSGGLLDSLISDEYLVDEMIEENEKVSFMIDIYNYVLNIADGKKPEDLKFQLDSVMDTNLFDLSKTESEDSQKVLLYDSLKISDEELELLYKAVEQICSPFGDNDDNTNRKKLVTSVILNRAMSAKFPNSVSKVLSQKHQFENMDSIKKADDVTVSDSTKQAVDTVVVGGDCAQRSVYFAKPSTAKKNKWDEKYKFTFNDGDKSDNSFNYYTTEEIESELAKYETTISGNVTKASLSAQKIIKWANSQVGKSEFENKHDNTTMSSSNSSPQFVKSAYFEGGMDYISGDIPCPNEIKRRDDGTIDWSDIPETAVIVSNSGIVSLYVGKGYVIEAGGNTIQKVTIDESQSAKDAKGWGFAATDQDDARDKLVVAIGGGGSYAQGWTPFDSAEVRKTGIEGVYAAGDKQYNVYAQGYNDVWGDLPYWNHNYGYSACGITSVAIILTGFGVDIDPPGVNADGIITNGNTLPLELSAELAKYGLKTTSYVTDKNKVIEHLKTGNPVLINIHNSTIGRTPYEGHYLTLLGIDASGKIFLGDPAGGGNNTDYYTEDEIFGGTWECYLISK